MITEEKKTSLSDEIQRRLSELKRASQDFIQMTNLIDGNYESRLTEIKALESKRDRLKEEVEESQKKSNSIIQQATEEAYKIQKQAASLLDEAKVSKLQSKQDQEDAVKLMNQAQAQLLQAQQRQKEADTAYRVQEERKKRIDEAIK